MDVQGETSVIGEVEVEGETYELRANPAHRYEAIRVADRSEVGSFTSAPGEMWRMKSDAPELMHAIVQEAMVTGLIESPPSD